MTASPPIWIDAGRLALCIRSVRLDGWTRIMPAVYAGTPTGSGPGDSRFASQRSAYTLLYAAEDFTTAFAETVVRDRFDDGRADRRIDWVEIEARTVVRLDMVDELTTLRAADLRADGPLRLGIPSDVVRAREHRLGRAFGKALFAGFPDVDAVLFGSRLTGLDVIAVRGSIAVDTLLASPAQPLADHDHLPVALDRLDVMISASPDARPEREDGF